jgi:hypothetical protein
LRSEKIVRNNIIFPISKHFSTMIYRIGSQGATVVKIQNIVGVRPDGIFGAETDRGVRIFQAQNNLVVDGIVGKNTLTAMGLLNDCEDCLIYSQHFMPSHEYNRGPVPKHWIIWHHTAGWDNPYQVIDMWASDRRAKVGTEFVIGGQHPQRQSSKYDGQIVQAFPSGGYAWHTGTGMNELHIQSIGIELCNIGPIKDRKTYVNTPVVDEQICTLAKPFRGSSQYQKYTDKQLDSLKTLTIHLANKYNIDLHEGLYKWVKDKGAAGFDIVNQDYANKNKGLYTHTNLTFGKSDCFPQPELIDLLLSL